MCAQIRAAAKRRSLPNTRFRCHIWNESDRQNVDWEWVYRHVSFGVQPTKLPRTTRRIKPLGAPEPAKTSHQKLARFISAVALFAAGHIAQNAVARNWTNRSNLRIAAIDNSPRFPEDI